MPFEIVYSDISGLTMYANLFDAADLTAAWNPTTSKFEHFVLAVQPNFALLLVEDSDRPGIYTYEISAPIPAVKGDEFYLIEVREKTGTSYDRENDILWGAAAVYWDGQQEITPQTLNSKKELTAQEVWENPDRTLTECPCDLTTITSQLEEIVKNAPTGTGIPPTPPVSPQTPRIGPNGSSGPTSGIRVS